MKVIATAIPEVLLIEHEVYRDDRGHLVESFIQNRFESMTGVHHQFVQDNLSSSRRGVVRGLHYQLGCPQGKLISVLAGEIFDVAVDIRRGSPTFGRWVGMHLAASQHRQLWVPEGFAHGLQALSEGTVIVYKNTDYYAPAQCRTILWNDADIGIEWPLPAEAILSEKDRAGLRLGQAELFA